MESTAEERQYQPGSGEPLVVVGEIPYRRLPAWRRRIEAVTELAVGLVGNMRTNAAGPDRSPVRTDGTMRGDTLLGLALEGQRVALDATERLVGGGAWVARPPPSCRWCASRSPPPRGRSSQCVVTARPTAPRRRRRRPSACRPT